jgi:hypothetical protein
MLIPRRSRGDKDSEPEEASDTGLARRVLAHAGTPEEKLERLLAERSRELEEQAVRFEQAMNDLERREELLRDMRTSVDRLLRLGASDLTEREVELQELGREFMEREARLSAEEAELNRRRSELGAVELKREAVEQRERTLAVREQEVAAAEAQRAAEPQVEPARAAAEDIRPSVAEAPVSLLFAAGAAYRLLEIEPRALTAGSTVDLDGQTYVVARLGRAPLPADGRRCAYLEPSVGGSSGASGSS